MTFEDDELNRDTTGFARATPAWTQHTVEVWAEADILVFGGAVRGRLVAGTVPGPVRGDRGKREDAPEQGTTEGPGGARSVIGHFVPGDTRSARRVAGTKCPVTSPEGRGGQPRREATRGWGRHPCRSSGVLIAGF